MPQHEKRVEQALIWIVQADGAQPAQAEQATLALRLWRAESPANEAAATEAQHRWDALSGLQASLRERFAEPADRPDALRQRQRRRLLLSIAGVLGTGAVAGMGLQRYWQQALFVAEYATTTAQLRHVQLPDGAPGSRLVLSPQSRVAVSLSRQRRSVDLSAGEAYFDVASDTGRPFEVRTREALIQVIGTAFTVRDRGGAISVGVERGRVRVTATGHRTVDAPPPRLADTVELGPGDTLSVRDGVLGPLGRADTAALAAWRDGWLVFDATPLGEALKTINAYRQRPILSSDPVVNALRLSGRFRAANAASLADALPLTLPVTAWTHPDGSVSLHAH